MPERLRLRSSCDLTKPRICRFAGVALDGPWELTIPSYPAASGRRFTYHETHADAVAALVKLGDLRGYGAHWLYGLGASPSGADLICAIDYPSEA